MPIFHGFPGEQRIGKNYILKHDHLEPIACLAPYLHPDAQIIVQGCYSARGLQGLRNNSLIDKIAAVAQGREVVGFPLPSFHFGEFISWNDKKIKIWSGSQFFREYVRTANS